MINNILVAHFALVKVRRTRPDELIKSSRPFATNSRWLLDRLDAALSACQRGVTMASLGLGWIGEPAVAHLLRPLMMSIGVKSDRR